MKILIIGNAGFIGSHLSRLLIAGGHEVVGLDIAADPQHPLEYPSYRGDILNVDDVLKSANGVELVINLAAKHHDFGITRDEFFAINEAGTRNVCACLSQLGIKKFIFYSSVAVYGYWDTCTSEATPINPDNAYGASKFAAENVIDEWLHADNSREALIIRPSVVFGPNNWANMYKLIQTIDKRRFVFIGPGTNIKTVAYVENLVAATVHLMDRMRPGKAIYNYADDPHHTYEEIVGIITDALGRPRYRLKLPLTPLLMLTSVIDVVAKITRINFPITANRIGKLNKVTWHGAQKVKATGFTAPVSIEEGLQRMVNWYLTTDRS